LGFNSAEIKKIEIRKEEFTAYGNKGAFFRIKVREMRDAVLNGCNFCPDFAANLADISIGSVGSRDGFSSVVIRSEIGKAAWENAKVKCEIEEIQDLSAIEKLTSWKMKRALKRR